MNNRIEEKFKELKMMNKKALITFITAGDPDLETSYQLVLEMFEQGADLVEIGIPFSDPVAEGPTIEKASMRALASGTTTDSIFELVTKLRTKTEKPLLLMLYINLVYKYGAEEFITKCQTTGVDGLIIPDMPYEEIQEVKAYAEAKNIYLINLIAPTTNEERLAKIVEGSKGFIYCVSSLGVTGVRSEITTDLENFYARIRKNTNLPLALGFGLSTKEQLKSIKGNWEAFIVGSKIVEVVAAYGKDSVEEVGKLVKNLKELE